MNKNTICLTPIPEFITKQFESDTAEAIVQKKSSGLQKRSFFGETPQVVEMSAEETKTLCEKNGITYKPGYEHRVIKYTCSDESVDRYGDIIRQNGWELKNYVKNPVVMGFHDYNTFPVGSGLKTSVEDGKLKMHILFADAETNIDADKAFKMAKAGFMKAGSVGFMPIESRQPTSDEIKTLGMNPWSMIYEKADLMEFSICGVPANPNAVQDMVSKGIVTKKDLTGWVSKEVLESIPESVVENKTIVTYTTNNTSSDSLVEEIRSLKDMIQTANEQKAGAVLSAKNKTLILNAKSALENIGLSIENALDSLDALIGASEETDSKSDAAGGSPAPSGVAADLKSESYYEEVQKLFEQTKQSFK